jgi:hypothetical protein
MRRLVWIGPGFLWMVSAAGSGELLFTPRVGALYGYSLLWALLAAVALKWVINRELGRLAVCTGAPLLEALDQAGWGGAHTGGGRVDAAAEPAPSPGAAPARGMGDGVDVAGGALLCRLRRLLCLRDRVLILRCRGSICSAARAAPPSLRDGLPNHPVPLGLAPIRRHLHSRARFDHCQRPAVTCAGRRCPSWRISMHNWPRWWASCATK